MAAGAPTKKANAGPILLVLPCIFWGLHWPMVAIGLTELDAWTLRALAIVPAGVLLLGFLWLSGQSLAVPRRLIGPLLLAGVLNIAIFQVALAFGIQFMNTGRAVIVVYTMPLWTALFGVWFLGEKLTRTRIAALSLGMCGLGVLLSQDLSAMANAPLGIALCLLAAAAFGGGTVAVRSQDWRIPSALIAGWQLILGGIPVLAGALLAAPVVDWPSISLKVWLTVVYALLLSQLVPYILWFRGVQLYPAVMSGLATLSIPIIGVLSGALIMDDPLGWRELLALGIVCGALLLVVLEPGGSAQTKLQ